MGCYDSALYLSQCADGEIHGSGIKLKLQFIYQRLYEIQSNTAMVGKGYQCLLAAPNRARAIPRLITTNTCLINDSHQGTAFLARRLFQQCIEFFQILFRAFVTLQQFLGKFVSCCFLSDSSVGTDQFHLRSEERRVGKERRYRGWRLYLAYSR